MLFNPLISLALLGFPLVIQIACRTVLACSETLLDNRVSWDLKIKNSISGEYGMVLAV